MPTNNQWETVKAQCAGFNEIGFVVKCDMQGQKEDAAPAIRIAKGLKSWHFSDLDWDVVIKQLAQLWKVVNAKERKKHQDS